MDSSLSSPSSWSLIWIRFFFFFLWCRIAPLEQQQQPVLVVDAYAVLRSPLSTRVGWNAAAAAAAAAPGTISGLGNTFVSLDSSSSSSLTRLNARKRRKKRKETNQIESSEDSLSATEMEPKAETFSSSSSSSSSLDDNDIEKKGTTGLNSSVVTEPVPQPPPQQRQQRGDQAVALEAPDIRSLVGGGPVTNDISSKSPFPTTPKTVDTSARTSSLSSSNTDDALQQLLKDAQSMQEKEKIINADGDEGGGALTTGIKNIISTIVTVDFFVVCAFLVWFLVGIFSSTVLDNDSIQIAFNGIFQPLVQPALGILMIGAIAGAIDNNNDDDDDQQSDMRSN